MPPHILEHIAINADEMELRERAIMNLQAQSRVRGMLPGLICTVGGVTFGLLLGAFFKH